MKKRELQNILAEHADRLISGEDKTELLIGYYGNDAPDLAPLLHLAQKIQKVLVPVSPRQGFFDQLQQDLLYADRQLMVSTPGNPWRPGWKGAATLGSLLSLVGLFLLLRRQRSRPVVVDVVTS